MRAATRAGALVALLLAGLSGCATVRGSSAGPEVAPRIEVLTPVDRVPITDRGVWSSLGGGGEEPAAATLLELRHDLAAALAGAGAEVCEGEWIAGVGEAGGGWLGSVAGDDVDAVVVTEIIAYGQLRKSWIWLLAGQALLAGVGHGVAAARLTGSAAAGWWVGAGELALETVTWVGGALLAARWVDPVIARVTVYRRSDGARLGRWTREGLRPLRELVSRAPADPRPRRLRRTVDRLFVRSASKVVKRVRQAAATRSPAAGGGE